MQGLLLNWLKVKAIFFLFGKPFGISRSNAKGTGPLRESEQGGNQCCNMLINSVQKLI
jgi:hypothetical protein